MSFSLMTPIQRSVIPHIVENRDIMGCSQTGSGKTIAFLAPIVTKMLTEGPPVGEKHSYGVSAPIVLILVPTRELADQIYKEARKLIHRTHMEVIRVYGGVPYDGQFVDIRNGCDILVAAPGRLIDFLNKGVITLSQVKYFIIDEADRILDMGFEEQLKTIVFDFDMKEKSKRQNLLFSATFDAEIRKIAGTFMGDYYFITNNQEIRANENIEQVLDYVDDRSKVYKLHEYLQTIKGSVIIFLETKRGVDYLKNFLDRANYNVISIHGDKTQIKRQEAIAAFSKGDVPILIATDVASRGLDFPNVAYVFNYDLPKNIDDYVHRIGRTGRCGNKGTAVSFVNENSMPIVKDLYLLLTKLKQTIPDWFEDLFRKNSSYSYDKNRSYKNKFNNNNSNNNYGGGERSYGGNGFSENKFNKFSDKPKFGNSSYGNRNNGPSSGQTSFNKFNNFPQVGENFFRKGENCPDVDKTRPATSYNSNNGYGNSYGDYKDKDSKYSSSNSNGYNHRNTYGQY